MDQIVSPSKIHMLKSLTPSGMVFGDQVFGRKLGLDEVMGVGPS